jgi:hypothetical protein
MISSKNGSWYKSNRPKRRGSNFKPPTFCEYFVFSCLIRKGTNLGPPDLESSQKGASSDIHIVHFGPHPICLKIPPSLPYRTHHNFATPCYCNRHCNAVRGNSKGTLQWGYMDWWCPSVVDASGRCIMILGSKDDCLKMAGILPFLLTGGLLIPRWRFAQTLL